MRCASDHGSFWAGMGNLQLAATGRLRERMLSRGCAQQPPLAAWSSTCSLMTLQNALIYHPHGRKSSPTCSASYRASCGRRREMVRTWSVGGSALRRALATWPRSMSPNFAADLRWSSAKLRTRRYYSYRMHVPAPMHTQARPCAASHNRLSAFYMCMFTSLAARYIHLLWRVEETRRAARAVS